jgi:hypothetical protein
MTTRTLKLFFQQLTGKSIAVWPPMAYQGPWIGRPTGLQKPDGSQLVKKLKVSDLPK